MEICKLNNVTRKQLAQDFELRPGTVSALVLQLIDRGLVEEARPRRALSEGSPRNPAAASGFTFGGQRILCDFAVISRGTG